MSKTEIKPKPIKGTRALEVVKDAEQKTARIVVVVRPTLKQRILKHIATLPRHEATGRQVGMSDWINGLIEKEIESL